MLKYFIIAMLFAFPVIADERCNGEYVPLEKRYEAGLLFELIKCEEGYKPSYLFGTMHSDAKDLLVILPPVMNAIEKSSSANFEIENNPSQTLAALQAMYYPADSSKTLRNEIGEDRYTQLKETLEQNRKSLPEISYMRMRPWAVAVLMQYPEQDNDGIHIDLRLENYAREVEVDVHGLETAEEQLKFFNELTDEESKKFLFDSLDNFEIADEMNDKLQKAYKSQDLYAMRDLADESFEMMDDDELQKKFTTELIEIRNERMFERVKPRIKDGAFIGVGALHLPWEYGLIRMFEDAGYRVFVVNE